MSSKDDLLLQMNYKASANSAKLPPAFLLDCPCDPAHSDGCEASGLCHCTAPYCGPRCNTTQCSAGALVAWQIALIVVAAVVVVGLIAAAVFLVLRKRKQQQQEAAARSAAAGKHLLKGSHSNLPATFAFDKDDGSGVKSNDVNSSPHSSRQPLPKEHIEIAEVQENPDDDDDVYVPESIHQPPSANVIYRNTNNGSNGGGNGGSGSNSPYTRALPASTQLPPPERVPLIRRDSPVQIVGVKSSKSKSSSSSSSGHAVPVSKPTQFNPVRSQDIPPPQHRPQFHATPIIAAARAELIDETSSTSSRSSRGAAVRNNNAYAYRRPVPGQQPPPPSSRPPNKPPSKPPTNFIQSSH